MATMVRNAVDRQYRVERLSHGRNRWGRSGFAVYLTADQVEFLYRLAQKDNPDVRFDDAACNALNEIVAAGLVDLEGSPATPTSNEPTVVKRGPGRPRKVVA